MAISPNPVQQYLDEGGTTLFTLNNDGSLAITGPLSIVGALTGATTGNFSGAVAVGSLSSTGTIVGSNSVLLARSQLTAAQLKALRATPVSLIAAPGAGKAIQVLAVTLHYNFLTTPFTINTGKLRLFYGTTASGLPLFADQATGFIDQGSSKVIVGISADNTGVTTEALGLNVAIFAGNDGGSEFTLGLGNVVIDTAYQIVSA